MDWLRRFLSFGNGERIAICTLLAVILLLLAMCFVRPFRQPVEPAALHELDALLVLREKAMEELKAKEETRSVQRNELTPFPFNPYTLTEEEGLKMGLADRQVRNIINYRNNGGHFFTKKDLAKLYTIGESDFEQLEPFIVLPEVEHVARSKREIALSKEVKQPDEASKLVKKKEIPIVDINAVDSTILLELPQVGSYIASRIVSYRERLGGFVSLDQLREVKGVDSSRYAAITPYLRLEDVELQLLDVNRADFKSLLRHPYLNYNQVRLIVNFREKKGMIKNWTQLQAVIGEEEPLNPVLERYLKY